MLQNKKSLNILIFKEDKIRPPPVVFDLFFNLFLTMMATVV